MDGMSIKYPVFTDKFRLLMKDRTQAEVAKAVTDILGSGHKISQSAIARYAQGSVPQPFIAIALAKVFGVDHTWLVDETQPLPKKGRGQFVPPKPGRSLSDMDLMAELARRYRLEAMKVLSILERAEKADWWNIVETLFSRGTKDQTIPELEDSLVLAVHPSALFGNLDYVFNLTNFLFHHHDELPGSDRGADELLVASLWPRAVELVKKHPEMQWVRRHREMCANGQLFPDRRDRIEAAASVDIERIRTHELPERNDDPFFMGGMDIERLRAHEDLAKSGADMEDQYRRMIRTIT